MTCISKGIEPPRSPYPPGFTYSVPVRLIMPGWDCLSLSLLGRGGNVFSPFSELPGTVGYCDFLEFFFGGLRESSNFAARHPKKGAITSSCDAP